MATLSKHGRDLYAKLSANLKTATKNTRNEHVPYYVAKFMDKLNIWDKIDMTKTLKRFNSMNIFWQPSEDFEAGTAAQYEPFENAIVLHHRDVHNPKNVVVFSHELTHALTSSVNSCMAGKVQVENKKFLIPREIVEMLDEKEGDLDQDVVDSILQNFTVSTTIENIAVYNDKYESGFSSAKYEGSEESLDSTYVLDVFRHLNEGATNLFAMLLSKKDGPNNSLVSYYEYGTKIAAQIYAIVGDKLWVNYFNQNTFGLAKDMGYEFDFPIFKEIFNTKLNKVTYSTECIKDAVDIQIELLHLFNERIQEEIECSDYMFYDALEAQEAVMNCYLQFAKLFDKGYLIDPAIEGDVNRYWAEFKRGAGMSLYKLDKRLLKDNMKPSNKIRIIPFVELCKKQQAEMCYFLPEYCGKISIESAQIEKSIGKVEQINKQQRKQQKKEYFSRFYAKD